jgi:hypothetical protein
VLPVKIWPVTEKTSVRATVIYGVRPMTDTEGVLARNEFKCVNQ